MNTPDFLMISYMYIPVEGWFNIYEKGSHGQIQALQKLVLHFFS